MVGEKKCPLCKNDTMKYGSLSAGDLLYCIECRTCGTFLITDRALHYIDDLEFKKDELYMISAVSRQFTENGGKTFKVTYDLLKDDDKFQQEIVSLVPVDVQSKVECILRYIAKKSNYPSDLVKIEQAFDYPIAFCRNKEELIFYIEYLSQRGLVRHVGSNTNSICLRMMIDGWEKIESLSKPNLESKQAFVAMWFNEKTDEAFIEGIKPLEKDTGFSMVRVDMKQFNEKICDRILAEIKKSRFLISEVTGHRQGVYFEAGFAMGLGLPVIWTCREDEKEKCHFDTRQYNHIFWKTPEELRDKLRDRILATVGKV